MYRFIEQDLLTWKNSTTHKPLIIRGARQVGKTYVVEQFAKNHFTSIASINFEFQRQFIDCFDTFDPKTIINRLAILTNQNIISGQTLLFLDEIQECPNAILALRYFKEQMPDLHVIAAGSLLELTLEEEQFRAPVGRVQSIFMKPCSFQEYLLANHQNMLLEYLKNITIKTGIEPVIHHQLIEKVKEYFILGGLPEIIASFAENQNLYECNIKHASLNEYYRRDFAKYSRKIKLNYLQKIFDKLPMLVSKHFKYVDIDQSVPSRDIKPALDGLVQSGLIYRIHHTNASGLPLLLGLNERKFKLIGLDIGLLQYASELSSDILSQNNLILLNRGAIAEQFVGQELLAYQDRYKTQNLYYWEREKAGSSAEIDYVINIGKDIIPIEVKAGTSGRLKSLHIFMKEKRIDVGVRISQNQFNFCDNILSIPLYLIGELPRLLAELS